MIKFTQRRFECILILYMLVDCFWIWDAVNMQCIYIRLTVTAQQLASVAQLVRALHRNRSAVGSIPIRGPCAAFFAVVPDQILKCIRYSGVKRPLLSRTKSHSLRTHQLIPWPNVWPRPTDVWPTGPFADKHLADGTFGRQDIWPPRHLAERIFGRQDIRSDRTIHWQDFLLNL